MSEAEYIRSLITSLQGRLALIEDDAYAGPYVNPEWCTASETITCYHPDVVQQAESVQEAFTAIHPDALKGRVPKCQPVAGTPYHGRTYWRQDLEDAWVEGYQKAMEPKKCPMCGQRQTAGGLWLQEEPSLVLIPNDPNICEGCRKTICAPLSPCENQPPKGFASVSAVR